MNKLLEITVFSWCNPGISSVYFHALSVENTRLYSFNTFFFFFYFIQEFRVIHNLGVYNIWVNCMFLKKKHYPIYMYM